MLLIFASTDMEELCSNERVQARKLGASGARKLRTRLAELLAATTVAELVAGRPHPLHGDRQGQFAVDLDGGRRLVFEVADEPPPLTGEGAIDWRRVRSIRIVYLGDYHD